MLIHSRKKINTTESPHCGGLDGKILEPIRLQDLFKSARSPVEKKIRPYILLSSSMLGLQYILLSSFSTLVWPYIDS